MFGRQPRAALALAAIAARAVRGEVLRRLVLGVLGAVTARSAVGSARLVAIANRVALLVVRLGAALRCLAARRSVLHRIALHRAGELRPTATLCPS